MNRWVRLAEGNRCRTFANRGMGEACFGRQVIDFDKQRARNSCKSILFFYILGLRYGDGFVGLPWMARTTDGGSNLFIKFWAAQLIKAVVPLRALDRKRYSQRDHVNSCNASEAENGYTTGKSALVDEEREAFQEELRDKK
ncbi:uncharacterized protein LOC133830914 [Humulus lupulus]|uniref:uncharacterized protein LOC133830914 n=1 Tax=Humulus lupulus TaxID=3486 RepID=UPI002B405725|nr:uncharacterized protein LOC133830914 [Humulus lupulus]